MCPSQVTQTNPTRWVRHRACAPTSDTRPYARQPGRVRTGLACLLVVAGVVVHASDARAAADVIECPASATETFLWAVDGVDDGAALYNIPENVFPNGFSWSGSVYKELHINSNGSISFGAPRIEFHPAEFLSIPTPTIAPFMADIDFRDQLIVNNPGCLSICEDQEQQRIMFTWHDVHHHDALLSPNLLDLGRTDQFQMILQRLPVGCGEEVVDIEFRYQRLPWYAGTSHGGDVDGTCEGILDPLLGCEPALAGFVMGAGRSLLLPGSGQISVADELLDGSNIGMPGVFRYRAVNGDILHCGNGTVDVCETCDDGNMDSGDGCNAYCLQEPGDGIGAGDSDSDGDGVADVQDNCPVIWNPGQNDEDNDGVGDECDGVAGYGERHLIGGGCTISSASEDAGFFALALFVALLLVVTVRRSSARPARQPTVTRRRWRWRKSSYLAAVLACVAWSGIPGAAVAQDDAQSFPVERFRLASDSDGIIGVEWADVPAHLQWNATLWMSASDDPLRSYVVMNGTREHLGNPVDHRVAATVSASIALWSRVQMNVELPLVLSQSSSLSEPMGAQLSSFGLSDARVSPKVQLLDASAHGLHMALMGTVVVPTADSRAYRGEPGWSVEPTLAVSRSFGGWRVAGNVGYRARPDVTVVDFELDDEIFARIGLGHRLATHGGPPLELDVSLATATSASAPFGATNQNYAEVFGGAAYDLPGPLVGLAAVGVGVANGIGSPDWRAIVGVRLGSEKATARDADGDGIVDRDDQCPLQAEDIDSFADSDGCPDLDNDGDGVLDRDDRCPVVAGVLENRGCPDADRDGDTIVDRLDNCPEEHGSADNAGCREQQLVVLRDSHIEILEKVYFETARAQIRRRSYALLENVASVLRAHPEIALVRIEGHTDSRADDDYNLDLSQRRAESVRQFLIELRVEPGRLEAIGFGETRPVASNRTRDGRAHNRRVDFTIGSVE